MTRSMYLLYGVKFNSEIDIVQFIFSQCVVNPFKQKLSLHKKVEKQMKRMTAPMKKDYLVCNLHIVQLQGKV